jgi:FAD/FMN-containing dehydrogenase
MSKIASIHKVELELNQTPSELESYSYDFGRLCRKKPLGMFHVRNETELSQALQFAYKRQIPVSIRGSGYSCQGQSLCEEGIVIVNQSQEAQFRLLKPNQVEVCASSRWGNLVEQLNKSGQNIPVLTHFLNTTIGGTLSVGGIGIASLAYGCQIDHVEKLLLILATGEQIWVSQRENQELFSYTLAGFGQIGAIAKVILRTIPYKPWVKWQINHHQSLLDLIEAIAWIPQWQGKMPDYFFAQNKGSKFMSFFGFALKEQHETLSKAQKLTSEQINSSEMGILPLWGSHKFNPTGCLDNLPAQKQVMCDYCVDYEGLLILAQCLERILLETSNQISYPLIYILGLSKSSQSLRFPFDLRPQSNSAYVFSFGVFYTLADDDHTGLELAQKTHQILMQKCIEVGGRPYLYGFHSLDEQTKVQIYGASYLKLKQLKKQLDPDNLLNYDSF